MEERKGGRVGGMEGGMEGGMRGERGRIGGRDGGREGRREREDNRRREGRREEGMEKGRRKEGRRGSETAKGRRGQEGKLHKLFLYQGEQMKITLVINLVASLISHWPGIQLICPLLQHKLQERRKVIKGIKSSTLTGIE